MGYICIYIYDSNSVTEALLKLQRDLSSPLTVTSMTAGLVHF